MFKCRINGSFLYEFAGVYVSKGLIEQCVQNYHLFSANMHASPHFAAAVCAFVCVMHIGSVSHYPVKSA